MAAAKALGKLAAKLGNAMRDGITKFTKKFGKQLKAAKAFIKNLPSTKKIAGAIKKKAAEAAKKVAAALKKKADAIKKKAKKAADKLKKAGKKAGKKLKGLFKRKRLA